MDDPIREYLNCLRVERGRASRTIEAYGRDLSDYASFLRARDVSSVADAARGDLAAYEADLMERGFAASSVKRRLSAIKGLYRYLVREERISKLEETVTRHDNFFRSDKNRLDEIESGNRVMQMALLALLDHGIDGNNLEQMKQAKEDLQRHLVER